MLYGETGDSIHEGSLVTWDPMIWIHEEKNKKNSSGQQRSKCFHLFCFHIYFISTSNSSTIDTEIGRSQFVSEQSRTVEGSSSSNDLMMMYRIYSLDIKTKCLGL